MDPSSVWKLFRSLHNREISELTPLSGYYSLIPLFPYKKPKLDTGRYEIHVNLPPLSNVPFAKEPVRIFDSATSQDGFHEKGGVVFHRNATLENGPVNYWYLPVPCHVILYLFFKVIESSGSSRPEIVLGQRIYENLKTIKTYEELRTGRIEAKFAPMGETSANHQEPAESSSPSPLDMSALLTTLNELSEPAETSSTSQLDTSALLIALNDLSSTSAERAEPSSHTNTPLKSAPSCHTFSFAYPRPLPKSHIFSFTYPRPNSSPLKSHTFSFTYSRPNSTHKDTSPNTALWPGSYWSFYMRVSVHPSFRLTEHLFPHTSVMGHNFVRVDNWEDHEVSLEPSIDGPVDIVVQKSVVGLDDEVVVQRMTSTVMEAGQQRRFRLHQKLNRLPEIFHGISTFNYFLENNLDGDWLSRITISIHLHGPGDFSVNGKQINLSAEPGSTYSFSIHNESKHDLFPYLFYFDPYMYSIEKLYMPAPVQDLIPPLKALGGSMSVRRSRDQGFDLNPRPIGFLKLFVAKEPLDLDWIPQISPFDLRFKANEGGFRAVLSAPNWQASVKTLALPA
ncbi:hypothetical protein C8J57DRAFT_1227042 [Mycena rebaudengoi]|nr:hypothetical protein C8J57DRAFT_1227042 [Mycena rebaudengoi]